MAKQTNKEKDLKKTKKTVSKEIKDTKTVKPKTKKQTKKVKVKEKSYSKQVKDELKKVKWPSKKEMVKYSVASIIFIFVFGVYFYGLDALFAWISSLVKGL